MIPTWMKNKQNGQDFYGNHFGGNDNNQNDQDRKSTQYQPPFSNGN